MKNYILRKKKGKGYIFFDKRNNIIKNKKTIDDALEGLYLPPAYDDVKINLNKKAKVLAIGYDNKKRAQYVYNKKFTEKMKKKNLMVFICSDYNIKELMQTLIKILN